MSDQAFSAFRSHVAANFALQEGLRDALDVGPDEVVALGAAHGLTFTAEDISRVQVRGAWTHWELETFGAALRMLRASTEPQSSSASAP